MSIRDVITVLLAEVGNVTVDFVWMNKYTFTNAHEGVNAFTCIEETNVCTVGASEGLTYFRISF